MWIGLKRDVWSFPSEIKCGVRVLLGFSCGTWCRRARVRSAVYAVNENSEEPYDFSIKRGTVSSSDDEKEGSNNR